MRAIAVVGVLLFHGGISAFAGGFIGVDVFFVISGFLITNLIVQTPDFSLLHFYERRAKRILPALSCVMLVCAIVAYVLFMPEEFAAFGKSLVATALFSSNFLFWNETGYFDAPPELKPLLHTWSLAVEEQFYLVYPLLLILCARFLNRRWIILLLPLTLASFVLSIWWTERSQETAFYLAPSRAWEFLLGCLLSVGAVAPVKNRLAREGLAVAGLALILWSIFTYSPVMVFPGLSALPPCLGTAILIWLGIERDTHATFVGRMLANSPLVFVGLISYSLYLWHWPLLVFAHYITIRGPSLLARAALLLAAFPLAYLTWRYVETPVRRSSYWTSQRVLITSVGASVTLIGFGLVVSLSGGLPGRISPRILALHPIVHERRDCSVTPERVATGELCVRGADGQLPSFALVGDSHADAISPGVFGAAERLGIAGYQLTAAGFRPLPGVNNPKNLASLTNSFVEFLRQKTGIKLVILVGYWQLQAEGQTYHKSPRIYKDDQYDGSGLAYNKISFERGLRRLIEMFPDRKFVIVEDVPTGPELEIAIAARALHIRDVLGIGEQLTNTGRFGVSREAYEAQLASYRPVLQSIASLPNATIFPLIDRLCDGEFCAGTRGEVLLFHDEDHLSDAGAEFFVDAFSQEFARLQRSQK